MKPVQPIQIALTAERQALIQRLSGQYAQVLELVPDATDKASGAGACVTVSVAAVGRESGIPRQQGGAGLKLDATHFGRRYSFVRRQPSA